MNDKKLTETQIENLIGLVNELQGKLKKKNVQLSVLRGRINNAKRTIKRLQGIVDYQRGRILNFYNGSTTGSINSRH